MAAGLKVWDAAGNLVLDTSTRTFRLLTVQDVGASNGSYVNPQLSTGTPVVGVSSQSAETKKTPTINVAGNTVSWDWTGIAAGDRATDASMIVMVY